jgi:hypothetical protein
MWGHCDESERRSMAPIVDTVTHMPCARHASSLNVERLPLRCGCEKVGNSILGPVVLQKATIDPVAYV